MAEENGGATAGGEQETNVQQQGETFTKDQVDKLIAEQTAGMRKKLDELLGETKAEREKRQALEKAQEEAETEKKRKAGEFQQLYEKSQAELEKERTAAATFKEQIRAKEVSTVARTLAASMTRDTKRAELLAEQAAKHIKANEEGSEVTFEIGGVVIEREKVMAHLKESFPFLVDGNQSTGGGAAGGDDGGAKSLNRSKMSAKEKAEFQQKHGQQAFLRLPK